ncbi:MAG: tRNA (adenosine(37)-N6)-dimethylallyltransferase MiaA [Blastocatellia bacterium AA13]|nr:MAG: tRNA (adenosine(37)-N6)-dimethylallyltransferase MiaA [Blastocatellia bacterium AA13]
MSTKYAAGQPIPAIVGPTASGKSELGIAIAIEFGGEIINLDSVQVYRKIRIATAKVPPSEQQGITHHLIDIVEPTENFTAGEYARRASSSIRDIESRGTTAILVGGTGFYLRALMQPLFDSSPTDPALRRRLKEINEKRGAEHLHRILRRLDPTAAARLSPRDWSRNMRAIEVRLQTGNLISDLQPRTPEPPDFADRIRVIALDPPRDLLYEKINARADRMFEAGLIEEVESLLAAGVPADAKAFQAHGYRRVVEHLMGKRSREDALNQMKLDTRRYAKRQLSWWRSRPGVSWISCFGDDPRALADAVRLLAGGSDKRVERRLD